LRLPKVSAEIRPIISTLAGPMATTTDVLGCGPSCVTTDAIRDYLCGDHLGCRQYFPSALGDGDEVEEDPALAARFGDARISVPDLVTCCCQIQVGVAARFLRKNVTHDGGVGYLDCDDEFGHLRAFARTTTTPSPLRSHDVATRFYFRAFAGSRDRIEQARKSGRSGDNDVICGELSDRLFGSSILRLTGRVNALRLFRNGTLPKPNDASAFTQFLGTFIRERDRMGRILPSAKTHSFLSRQFMNSLPHSVKSISGLCSCVVQLSKTTESTARQILAVVECNSTDPPKRANVLALVVQFLEPLYACSPSKVMDEGAKFVASQIVADLEEILDDGNWDDERPPFFGLVYSLHAGYGAKEALSILSLPNLSAQDCKPRKRARKQVSSPPVLPALAHVLQQMESPSSGPPTDILECLGLKRVFSRRTGHPSLLITLTGRIMSIVDVEHMLCKLHLCISRTRGARAHNQPRPSSPHCHPTMWEGPDADRPLSELCTSIFNTFKKVASTSSYLTSNPVLLTMSEQESEHSLASAPCAGQTIPLMSWSLT
jgi:hypothetical protein